MPMEDKVNTHMWNGGNLTRGNGRSMYVGDGPFDYGTMCLGKKWPTLLGRWEWRQFSHVNGQFCWRNLWRHKEREIVQIRVSENGVFQNLYTYRWNLCLQITTVPSKCCSAVLTATPDGIRFVNIVIQSLDGYCIG